ncbi:helix-turn-helix domain-containing protein [Pediococcus acidilactici]|uniref:helix-turn-helix domain-containing protein n=1 Tax=Pediococcus acidilactici TaxID=1254 RepID=UPI001058F155|nr:helix-turn-helix domain-containing protein [Pediococcus acidilactici]KAF0517145.1 helix-turn-helix domain-containing protein [Pediococcus acidilactici]MCT3036375.1 helix-turn-helix domain-containing protein [Pediococcus acidilactici]QQC46464.1 helix-turn-helix domain-containing protein [Pediococcus acidilactici]
MLDEKPNYYAIIPASVRYDRKLQPNAILLYGEITALTKKDGYCWAGDSYFADLYEVAKSTVQTWLKRLEQRGHIIRTVVYKDGSRQIKQRRITITDSLTHNPNTYAKKLDNPTPENKGTYAKNLDNPIPENWGDSITTSTTNNNTNINKNRAKPPKPVAHRDQFESLWTLYPNKKGKETAWKSYSSSIKAGVTDDDIRQGINNYLAEIKVKGTPKRYIKHGGTWFRQKGWEDEYDTTPDTAPNRKRPVTVRETLPDWAQDETTVPEPSNAESVPTTEEINAKLAKLRARRESR